MTPPLTRSVLAGLVGDHIQGSLSPAVHEEEAAALGIPMVYRIIDLAHAGWDGRELPRILDTAAAMGFDGLNITHPYKMAIVPLLDALEGDAALLGSVNTVVFRDGRKVGHNTDSHGFADSWRRNLGGLPVQRVAQIGAGGAGLATALAMLNNGAQELSIFDMDRDRTANLVQRLSATFPARKIAVAASAAEALALANGVVQASPVGMYSMPGLPFDPGLLSPSMWVADVIYTPRETALLHAARVLGCSVMNGEGMIVLQAAEAFDLFTGARANRERMMAARQRRSQP